MGSHSRAAEGALRNPGLDWIEPMRKLSSRFAAVPISMVALHSIMLGTIASAAEYDGWISWGHEASALMVVPIVAWAVCAYACRR